MKSAVDDNPWGTQVYYGQINDREVLDQNVILMTLIIPPEIDSAEIDSIALYLSDGTIFAQGFLRKPRQKVEGSACYIYAYINAPEPLTDVETWLKARTAFPQVDDYCDLPKPEEAQRGEYVVNNGHCGYSANGLAEYLPTLVACSSSAPKTPVFPPNQPFPRANLGSLISGQYKYSVTALNASGETTASQLAYIQLVPLVTPTASV